MRTYTNWPEVRLTEDEMTAHTLYDAGRKAQELCQRIGQAYSLDIGRTHQFIKALAAELEAIDSGTSKYIPQEAEASA
jgi:hypothetical protein